MVREQSRRWWIIKEHRLFGIIFRRRHVARAVRVLECTVHSTGTAQRVIEAEVEKIR
jgi:hypothetical protein